jgi:hypothetical protein
MEKTIWSNKTLKRLNLGKFPKKLIRFNRNQTMERGEGERRRGE